MKSAVVVIEIGSNRLKVIGLGQSMGRGEIVKLVVKNIVYMPDDLITKMVSNIIKELKLRPDPLVISFPRNQVTVRNLKFPSTDSHEVEEMVKLHAERQSPYSKEEIICGYQIIGTDEIGYTEGLLAIAHRDSVKRIFKILEGANFYSERVELSSQGVISWFFFARPLKETEKEQTFIILDIDFNFSDLQVVSKRNLIYTRNISIGAEQLSDEAKQTKFVAEVKQSLIMGQNEGITQKPTRLFISGAVSSIRELSERLKNELEFPVEVISPFENIPISKQSLSLASAVSNDVSLSAVMGLALDSKRRRITLIPPEVKVRKLLKERMKEITLLGILVIYLFVAICGIFWERMYNKQSYLAEINMRLGKISEETNKLEEMRRGVRLALRRLDMKSSSLNYLYEVHRLIPAQIIIERINFEEGNRLTLRGSAPAMANVFKFITTLEDSPYFKRIETKYTTQEKSKEGKDVSRFEISCSLAER